MNTELAFHKPLTKGVEIYFTIITFPVYTNQESSTYNERFQKNKGGGAEKKLVGRHKIDVLVPSKNS